MRRMMLTLVLAASVGCQNDLTGSSDVNGAYLLREVNGAPMPYTQMFGAAKSEIFDWTITLYEDGTFAESSHGRYTAANGQESNDTWSETGTYLRLGNSIGLRYPQTGFSRPATLSGNTMTFVEGEMTFTFRKDPGFVSRDRRSQ